MSKTHQPKISEDTFTIHVATFLRFQYPGVPFTHVANERKTSARHGAKLKRMGLWAGMPDMLIFRPKFKANGQMMYCGIAIELKVGRNKPSDLQKECLKALAEAGWLTKVCYNLDQVQELTQSYFGR